MKGRVAAARNAAEQGIYLSVIPAEAAVRRRALYVVIASILVFIIAAPFARIPLARIEAFIPAYQSIMVINDLITAVLLFGQFRILQSRSLLFLASGYLFTAVIVIIHTLTFPGLFSPTGLLGSGPQTTAWLYMFWHGGFPLAVIFYSLLNTQNSKQNNKIEQPTTQMRNAVKISIAVVIALVVAITLLTTSGGDLLPVIMRGNSYSPAMFATVSTVWSLNLLALVVLWFRRPHTVMDIWLMVVSCAWLFDIGLSAVLNAGRFDLGFYAGRIYGLLAASYVLIALLRENNILYARLAYSFAAVDHYARGLEGQVETSEEKHRIFMEQARDGIFVLDIERKIIEANRETENLLGCSRSDILGRKLEDFLSSDNTPDIRNKLTQLLSEKVIRIEKICFQHADGKLIYVDATSTLIEVDGVPSILFIAHDVTERTKLEHQLRHSQKMEAMGQLTGGIAHDFNNLLTIIICNAEILTEKFSNNENILPTAAMILSAGERASELTRQLLAFARRQPLQPKPADINRLITGMEGMLRRTLGEHVEISLNTKAGLWEVTIDATQLESAILNLAVNARDAMPSGGKLMIETGNVTFDDQYAQRHDEVRPGDYSMIAISDTGIGMSPEVIRRAFEPFYTTKEVGKGTGLGLSMVFGFIKQSGGHIKIYSEVGHGTCIKMYLPRNLNAAANTAPRAEIANPLPRGNEAILVVEDDQLVRQHAITQLSTLGYQVMAAENGTQAIEILNRGDKFDLLFTDVVMPGGINGRALADKALEMRPGLKVLFTSGYTHDVMLQNGRLDPGVRLLTKPYRLRDLATNIRNALDVA